MINKTFFNNFIILILKDLNNKKKKNKNKIKSMKMIKINLILKHYFNVNVIKKKLRKIFFLN